MMRDLAIAAVAGAAAVLAVLEAWRRRQVAKSALIDREAERARILQLIEARRQADREHAAAVAGVELEAVKIDAAAQAGADALAVEVNSTFGPGRPGGGQ